MPTAVLAQIAQHIGEILPDEMRQHPAVVDFAVPADERFLIGILPEPGDQAAQHEVLRETHLIVRRHLEVAHFQQAEAAGGAVRAVELVDAELGAVRVAGGIDQQVAERAVHIPRQRRVRCLRAF